jgi:hypothetical protein
MHTFKRLCYYLLCCDLQFFQLGFMEGEDSAYPSLEPMEQDMTDKDKDIRSVIFKHQLPVTVGALGHNTGRQPDMIPPEVSKPAKTVSGGGGGEVVYGR